MTIMDFQKKRLGRACRGRRRLCGLLGLRDNHLDRQRFRRNRFVVKFIVRIIVRK